MSPASRGLALRRRSVALQAIRSFFLERGFLEVDSPLLLNAVPVESSIAPLRVELQGMSGSRKLFLPTSPEGALKKILADLGLDCFEIGHAFRDGEQEGSRHRAHFRMLEWYRLGGCLEDLIQDTIGVFRAVASALDTLESVPGDRSCSKRVASEWERLLVPDALRHQVGLQLLSVQDLPLLVEEVRRRGLGDPSDWRDALGMLLSVCVEDRLGHDRPTLLIGYPLGLAAQARAMIEPSWLAAQFELYIDGIELANCYEEKTDPEEQRQAFLEEARRARALGMEPSPIDEAYLDALARLPERCAGGSIGIDRMLMVLLGSADIDQVRP